MTASFDLVVRNGTVIDGTTAPRRIADIAVGDGRIVEIGDVDGRGRRELDAEGRFVVPGFIDGHTHLDAQVFWDPLGTCSSWYGVTTAVLGNCGFTIAPITPGGQELAIASIERAEDIDRETLLAGVPWSWTSFESYLDIVEQLPLGLNCAVYVGHSALRSAVMGERAFEQAADQDDLVAMRAELRRAVAAGALGLSTSRSTEHRCTDDRPVASRLADWDEVVGLVDVLADAGRGVFQLAGEQHSEPELRRAYLDRLIALARSGGRPVTFAMSSNPYYPGAFRDYLDGFARADAQGATVRGQVHVRQFRSVLGFPVRLPFDTLPGWIDLRARPLIEQRRALLDPIHRAALVRRAVEGPYAARAVGAEARAPDYVRMEAIDATSGDLRSVAAMAAERGVHPVELIIDLSLAADFEQYFVQPFSNFDDDDVLEMLVHPGTVVAGSDSGAHVSQLLDASMPVDLLCTWARDREVFTWEQAVAMVTAVPADLWGFTDRGRLVPGAIADLVVLDPDRLAPGVPRSVDDLPGGGRRLIQSPRGIAATVVAGDPVLLDGEHTGAHPGRLLRDAGIRTR